jgi:hypothetical protein
LPVALLPVGPANGERTSFSGVTARRTCFITWANTDRNVHASRAWEVKTVDHRFQLDFGWRAHKLTRCFALHVSGICDSKFLKSGCKAKQKILRNEIIFLFCFSRLFRAWILRGAERANETKRWPRTGLQTAHHGGQMMMMMMI